MKHVAQCDRCGAAERMGSYNGRMTLPNAWKTVFGYDFCDQCSPDLREIVEGFATKRIVDKK